MRRRGHRENLRRSLERFDVNVLRTDVTRAARAAREVAGRGPYRLLLDTGCYQGLDDAERARLAELVGRVAEDRAALLMFALTPGGAARPRTFRGASEREIRARFEDGWDLVWTRP